MAVEIEVWNTQNKSRLASLALRSVAVPTPNPTHPYPTPGVTIVARWASPFRVCAGPLTFRRGHVQSCAFDQMACQCFQTKTGWVSGSETCACQSDRMHERSTEANSKKHLPEAFLDEPILHQRGSLLKNRQTATTLILQLMS